jgi:hypothetical protein
MDASGTVNGTSTPLFRVLCVFVLHSDVSASTLDILAVGCLRLHDGSAMAVVDDCLEPSCEKHKQI